MALSGIFHLIQPLTTWEYTCKGSIYIPQDNQHTTLLFTTTCLKTILSLFC